MGECISKEEYDKTEERAKAAEAKIKALMEADRKEKKKNEDRMNELQEQVMALNRNLATEQKEHHELAEELAADEDSMAIKLHEAQEKADKEKAKKKEEKEKVESLEEQKVLANRKLGALEQQLEEKQQAFLLAARVLTPMQMSIKEGDAVGLHRALDALQPIMQLGEDEQKRQFGDMAGIVKPIYEQGTTKHKEWQEILATLRVILKKATGDNGNSLQKREASHLFTAMKEAGITGLSLEKSDAKMSEKLAEAFLNYYMHEGGHGNKLQKEIIRRVIASNKLADFDFTDLRMCLSLCDRAETPENEFFLGRARTLIDSHDVPDFKSVLSSLETILFFLRFLDKEDLTLTYQIYRGIQPEQWIMKLLKVAEQQYCAGNELVNTAGMNLFSEENVMDVLAQLQKASPSSSKTMRGLRTIFYWWAQIMKDKFNLLVLPHHTQIVCMLICLEFIQGPVLPDCGALIAEMGTGEGKSAVIASMALYCVTVLGKKVHVVVDDESLVERDFQTFKPLFNKFKTPDHQPVKACLCVSATKKAGKCKDDESVLSRVDETADIVYCEAKHVQSFYTHLAKLGGTDFDMIYKDRILVLDEVDALVIDESPNVPFVYENEELSTFATKVASGLVQNLPPSKLGIYARSEAEKRIERGMLHAAQTASKWVLNTDYCYDQGANRYFAIQHGRINEGAWSLALEYKNYSDRLTDKVTYNERLFVMNRPRVFRKYSRVIGLSGSVGNDAERSLLKTIYHAQFFKVPKFLETCRDSQHFEAHQRGIIIDSDENTQWHTISDKAFENHQHVPVLIIAKSRESATQLAKELQSVASAKGMHGNDIVLSLSRDLYETKPDQYKENLFKCTHPVGKGSQRLYRIAITDPRGGRGTDYRVSDADADIEGGLLLIIQYIPKQSRDWIQYLGRTARQDRHGQWMAVLNRKDYEEDISKFKTELDEFTAVKSILQWGNEETVEKVKEMHGQYNRGLRMNEISEEVARLHLLHNAESRGLMQQLCMEYGRMSIDEIDNFAKQIPDLRPNGIRSEAIEVGADSSKPAGRSAGGGGKSVVILIDRSSSMLSTDAGGKSRYEVCRDCILDIFNKNIDDGDYIGLYTFESQVRESFPLTEKGPNKAHLAELIENIPQPDGLTKFYDGVLHCLEKLKGSFTAANYLIALTDGDDNMSRQQPNGEMVTNMVRGGDVPGLSLITITVGRDIKPKMLETMKYWTHAVQSNGNVGMHIPADHPATLFDAFAKVAELIDEPAGETEL